MIVSVWEKENGGSIWVGRTGAARLDFPLSQITKQHWAIESMHWDLDRNLRQDSIKRKAEWAARNLDTIQRMVLALIAAWKNRRKKISDKQKGTAQIIRELSVSFTNMLLFLAQKWEKFKFDILVTHWLTIMVFQPMPHWHGEGNGTHNSMLKWKSRVDATQISLIGRKIVENSNLYPVYIAYNHDLSQVTPLYIYWLSIL